MRLGKNLNLWVRILISVSALTIAALHMFCYIVEIDTIVLVLIGISLIPWFSHLIKSFEIGGVRITLKELQEVKDKAKLAGLVAEDLTAKEERDYSFQLVETEDPILALAGLRIEIEKKLKILAEKNKIGTRMQGVGRLINDLKNREVIGVREYSVIADMLGTLNRAVHAEKIDSGAVDWTMEYGPKILKALDEKIEKKL